MMLRRLAANRFAQLIALGLIIAVGIFFLQWQTTPPPPPDWNLAQKSLDERIEISLTLAREKLTETLEYLQKRAPAGNLYPVHTENEAIDNRKGIPDGAWITGRSRFWSAGAFPGLLWKMSEIESDPRQKVFWQNNAKLWSKSLERLQPDVTLNNLFVFRPWWESTSGTEKQQQLQKIFRGATYLAKPYSGDRGRFHLDIGVMGYEKKANRTDKQTHWHAFIDHTINVEQLLWAAARHPNKATAADWHAKAIRHIKTLAKTFGSDRHPGNGGTWQRGYFDFDPRSPRYGQFLFNEAKQGWGDRTTWSRGQAWFIYSASVTYQYSKDAEVLAIAKEAIDYFLDRLPDRFPGELRRPQDFVPPWDFDYALEVNPDTERDSSAAAIAVSGIEKLIAALPTTDSDRQRYLEEVKNILLSLTSTRYLALNPKEMNILRHGCYHHFDSVRPSQAYDNGTIWGDYFFIDALLDYRQLAKEN